MARQTEMIAKCRFERAGMGLAPFRLLGIEAKVYVSHPGATPQPGGTCDFCGTGIRYVFRIRSADGKEYGVGCDCVRHTGDSGLVKVATEQQRKIDRDNRHERERRKIEALRDWYETSGRDLAATLPSPNSHRATEYNETLADYVAWYQQNAGTKGKIESLTFAKRKIEELAR